MQSPKSSIFLWIYIFLYKANSPFKSWNKGTEASTSPCFIYPFGHPVSLVKSNSLYNHSLTKSSMNFSPFLWKARILIKWWSGFFSLQKWLKGFAMRATCSTFTASCPFFVPAAASVAVWQVEEKYQTISHVVICYSFHSDVPDLGITEILKTGTKLEMPRYWLLCCHFRNLHWMCEILNFHRSRGSQFLGSPNTRRCHLGSSHI